jgi:predicted site-specific integrase-resolvase
MKEKFCLSKGDTKMSGEKKQEKELGTRYLTINEILEEYPISERTLRRWTKDGTLPVIHDRKGHVKIALQDVEKAMENRQVSPGPLRQQVWALLARVERLEQQHQNLKQQMEELRRQDDAHQQQILTLLTNAEEQGVAGEQTSIQNLAQLLAGFRHLRKTVNREEEMLKKRGLPPDTLRLVDFAKAHQATVWAIKQLFKAGEIQLEIYQRTIEAKRNQQEWWITLDQHRELANYWRIHGIPFAACQQCEHN